jgi:hypothetical protein
MQKGFSLIPAEALGQSILKAGRVDFKTNSRCFTYTFLGVFPICFYCYFKLNGRLFLHELRHQITIYKLCIYVV